jgi:tetratricopeptide (TPR) repeat protein
MSDVRINSQPRLTQVWQLLRAVSLVLAASTCAIRGLPAQVTASQTAVPQSAVPLSTVSQSIAPQVQGTASSALPGPYDDEPAWLSLERGKRLFQERAFSEALIAFERAISRRRNDFTAAEVRLGQVLDTRVARSAGDSISALLTLFAGEDFIHKDYAGIVQAAGGSTRRLLTALLRHKISDSHRALVQVILAVLEYRSDGVLDDSIRTLRELVGLLKRYPEAEFWKGRIFMVEGELGLAELQFRRADDWRESLEIPGERSTILYALLDLYEVMENLPAWEATIAVLRADDRIEQDPFLREAMISTLRNAGFDRFMLLYRLEPVGSLDANRRWAEFMLERGRRNADLYAAVAANMLLTRAIAMIQARDRNYTWAGLADFMQRIQSRADIMGYLNEQQFYPILMTLSDALFVANARQFALPLWRIISRSALRPYDRLAADRLVNPQSAVRRMAP